MDRQKIISIAQRPELTEKAASWFSDKWGVPVSAYLESMRRSLVPGAAVPAWYVILDDDGEIVAGLGVIENDFHKRPDLTPNLCALYVARSIRLRGTARALMNHACRELYDRGIEDAWLITTHTAFYERCGWEFYGMIEEDDGNLIRMYHRKTGK